MSLDLEPIKARIARATPGPWRVKETDPRSIHRGTVQVEEHGRVIETVAECYCGGYEGHGLRNAELVANAPTDLDALVAEVERLREDAVVARSVETTLTVRDEERLAALLDAERENTALRLENERLRIDHHTLMSVALALADETDHDGYRPERGRDEVVDRALDVRAEVERLRENAEARERFLKREGDLLRAVERERDDLRRTLARLEDFSYGQQLALNNADVNHNAVLFALSDEGGHNGNGWRPSRGLDVLVDLALDVREERDRLRAQRALDNEALARAWDEGRDRERAATVRFLRGNREASPLPKPCWEADIIERGEHRREGEP